MENKILSQVQLPQQVQLSNISNPDWKELFDKLWEKGYYLYHGREEKYCRHQPEKVRLSQEGWNQIKRLIKERGITVSVQNSCSGFSCSICLWKAREEPYPGAEIPAEAFMEICSHMLPGTERSGFKEGWAEFEPLFTCSENVERLKWSKLALPRDSSFYDY